jgi:hypothetical protein
MQEQVQKWIKEELSAHQLGKLRLIERSIQRPGINSFRAFRFCLKYVSDFLVMCVLIEKGLDVNHIYRPIPGVHFSLLDTYLVLCHTQDEEIMVEYLLLKGVDPNRSQNTAFIVTQKQSHIPYRLIRLLVKHGLKQTACLEGCPNRRDYYWHLRTLIVLCTPLVLPQFSKQNWLSLDLVRTLELFL